MTFERTVLLSVALHAAVLAALAVAIRRPYIVLHPFEVNLVAAPAQNQKLFASGAAVQKRKTAPRPAAPPKEKATLPPPPARQKTAMPALEEKQAMSREQSVVNSALQRLRARERRLSLVSNALERLQGVEQVEKTVKLKETLQIGKKSETADAASGNGALSSYLGTVKAMIWKQWYLPELKTHNGTAVISIIILKDGTLIAKGFDKHSGDALLDGSALRAIERTGKVPPPPPPYQNQNLEIGLRFTPNGD